VKASGWKYAMILVDIDDFDQEVCQLSELFNIDGHHAFCKTELLSTWELMQAAKDVQRDGVNRWFYDNGTFSWEKDEETSRYTWNWTPSEDYPVE
jgi:hypothetical protein|tara:strand:+ start:771 stop:1055 length:285 start_codon:yes stop_codon:yes gene_type:complete